MLKTTLNLETKGAKDNFIQYYLNSYQSHRLFNTINDIQNELKEKLRKEIYNCLEKNVELFFDTIKNYDDYYNNIYQDMMDSLQDSFFILNKKHASIYLENQSNLKINKNMLVFQTHRNNKAQFQIVYENNTIKNVQSNKTDLYNKNMYIFKEDFSYNRKEMKIFLDLFIVDSIFKMPEINHQLNKKLNFYNTLIKSFDRSVLYNKENFNIVKEFINNMKLNDAEDINIQLQQFQDIAGLLHDKNFFNIIENPKENSNKI